MSLPSNLNPDKASPPWLNKGDNSWQLTAATLVGLQSVLGLVILYGSIVKKKWAVNLAFMALYAFAAVLVCWVAWGYRMAFGDKFIHFLEMPNISLDAQYLIDIWCLEGWLSKKGIIDYSRGYVIHLSSGVASFTAAYWVMTRILYYTINVVLFFIRKKVNVGPRTTKDKERFPPNNILLMLAGEGLIWMGWIGFNGGDPYTVSTDSSLAVLNTHVCTTTSLLTWLMLDIIFFGKPSVIGVTQGMITGLVCITPAAGVVQGWAAILMGMMSGYSPWYTMMVLHKKIGLLKQVVDTMAVFHMYAVAGSLGGILTGLFAVPKLNRLFYMVDNWQHYIGFFYRLHTGHTTAGFKQLGIQLRGIVFVVLLNIFTTNVICLLISLIIPLRLAEDELQTGDDAIHGEEAYGLWGDGEKYESKLNSIYEEFPPPSKGGEETSKSITAFEETSEEEKSRFGAGQARVVMKSETASSADEQQLSDSTTDTRGKHRILAELKRVEQESKFFEVSFFFFFFMFLFLLSFCNDPKSVRTGKVCHRASVLVK
ncbi:hypothetical protein CXB51_027549 [Gossypium anomalum]|uniref:Ammonium transporter AmtB-like domain-containing protein n=1 Tax=Gossypium anomalum TaxID=47600 RepID=A0A8J5Y603_9ROSI|nr:hypothetical protein CXB51_027549 [Gossypium anomalum]